MLCFLLILVYCNEISHSLILLWAIVKDGGACLPSISTAFLALNRNIVVTSVTYGLTLPADQHGGLWLWVLIHTILHIVQYQLVKHIQLCDDSIPFSVLFQVSCIILGFFLVTIRCCANVTSWNMKEQTKTALTCVKCVVKWVPLYFLRHLKWPLDCCSSHFIPPWSAFIFGTLWLSFLMLFTV